MAETDSSEVVKEGAEVASFANIKTLGEATAFWASMSMGNAVAHQQAMWQMYPGLIAKSNDAVLNLQAAEGTTQAAILGQALKGLDLTPPQRTTVA